MTDVEAEAHLKTIASSSDSDIEPALTAIWLSESCAGVSREKYINTLSRIADSVTQRYAALLERGGSDDARTRLAALKHVLSDEYDFRLDHPEAEALEGADMARVIERRKGNSAAITILYIYAARKQGWTIYALPFPGTILCRMDEGPERLIFHAPRQCKLMAAPDLRAMLKSTLGEKAELSAAYFEPMNNRQTLVRLQNYIKLRLIEMGDYGKALDVVERMREINPQEYRLYLDAGVLYAKTHQPAQAIPCLETYIQKAPQGRDRQDALQLLYDIRAGLLS